MKTKILFLLSVGVVTFCSMQYGSSLFHSVSEYKELSEQETALLEQTKFKQDEIASLQESVDLDLNSLPSTNLEVAKEIGNLEGVELSEIIAQQYTTTNQVFDVLTIKSIDEVASFTDTVDLITFNFSLKDLDAFMKSYKDLKVTTLKTSIDVKGKVASVSVKAIHVGDNTTNYKSESSTENPLLDSNGNIIDESNFLTFDDGSNSKEVE